MLFSGVDHTGNTGGPSPHLSKWCHLGFFPSDFKTTFKPEREVPMSEGKAPGLCLCLEERPSGDASAQTERLCDGVTVTGQIRPREEEKVEFGP